MAENDRRAFEVFYDRYAPRVFGFLLRFVGRRSEAEDILQDVFLQAWQQAARYESVKSTPIGWLFQMARTRAIDHLRRGSVRKSERTPSAASEPIIEAANAELASDTRSALSRLSDVQRGAICLAFYRGMTHEEVAVAQGVPLGTAKQRIRRGMQRMRELLNGMYGE